MGKEDDAAEQVSLMVVSRTESSSPTRTGVSSSPRRDNVVPSRFLGVDVRDQLIIVLCIVTLLLATGSVLTVLILSLVGRVPLLEPDVRLINWDQMWKAEVGGMKTESSAGWEEFRTTGTLDLDSLGKGEFTGPPKVAFMFLVRGPMPLIPLWERFLANSEGRASIYIHASWEGYNVSEGVDPDSIFHDKQIPGVHVEWGGLGMVRAERQLIAAALEDPANQRFVLLSESCIPIRTFDYVSTYLLSTNKSFIANHQTDGWRYPTQRMPSVPRSKFKKGSQWVALTRRHAELVNIDHKFFTSFAQAGALVPDESYIQTLVPFVDPGTVEPRSVSFVQWPSIFSEHPKTFPAGHVTRQLIRQIQSRVKPTEETVDSWWGMSKSPPCSLNGSQAPCFLFARKFKEDALPSLLALKDHLGY